MEQPLQHLFQHAGAALVALGQLAGVALETAGSLAGQVVETAHVPFGGGARHEDLREGHELGGLGPAVGLGELGPERRHRRRKAGVARRQPVGAFGASVPCRPLGGEASYGAPEGHGSIQTLGSWRSDDNDNWQQRLLRLGVLDRPWGDLHRRDRPCALGRAGHRQAAFGRPGLRGPGGGGHAPVAGCAGRSAVSGRARRGHPHGHDGSHQRPSGTQGRAHPLGRHPRLRRRPGHRRPGAAGPVRSEHRQARAAARGSHRGRRAAGGRRPGGAGAGRGGAGPGAGGRGGGGLHLGRHRLPACRPEPGPRDRRRAAGRGGGLRFRRPVARGLAPAPLPAPGRDDGGGRLSDADPAGLCGSGGAGAGGGAAVVHDLGGRPRPRRRVPGPRCGAVGTRRRGGGRGAHGVRGRPVRSVGLRHGRHLHRRLPLRRIAGAAPAGGRGGCEAAHADAGRGDRGRRRRLDPELRRAEGPRRT